MIGKTLGHYEITEKLGEGGMGAVYKARDTRLNRFVAIKVLPAAKVGDPDRKRRFEQEAKFEGDAPELRDAAADLRRCRRSHARDLSGRQPDRLRVRPRRLVQPLPSSVRSAAVDPPDGPGQQGLVSVLLARRAEARVPLGA